MSDFDGLWIAKEVLELKDISLTDKAVLAAVTSLDKKGGCFASNKYLAEELGISERTVMRSLAVLSMEGFVTVTVTDYGRRAIHSSVKKKQQPKPSGGVPTLDELTQYAVEKQWTMAEFAPRVFIEYYNARQWKIEGKPITDWRSVATGWVKRYREKHKE